MRGKDCSAGPQDKASDWQTTFIHICQVPIEAAFAFR